MDNRPIAFLDSGFGGLSILKAVKKLLPNESLLYFGDNSFAPYGEKDSEFIKERVVNIIQFLKQEKAKLVVVACNTATVVGIEYYRQQFSNFPIVGVVPVVKSASERSKEKTFALLATKRTIESEYQKNLLKQFAEGFEVIQIPAGSLVEKIEAGDMEAAKKEVIEIINKEILNKVSTLVLGSTHFALLKETIENEFGEKLLVLDSGKAVANQVKRVLENNNILGDGSGEEFFTSGDEVKFKEVAEKLLERKIGQVRKALN